jgi:antitoxin component YwqK of YwqJK toxin-antitoxin module
MNKKCYIFLLSVLVIGCSDKEQKYTYYDNGSIKSEWTDIDEKGEGDLITYYENGDIKSRVPLKNDLRNGEAVYFHEGGAVSAKGYFIDDLEQGIHYEYYPSGKLQLKANFKNDLQDSITLFFSEESEQNYLETHYIEGTPVWEKEYKNGKLVENKNVEFFTVTFDADTVSVDEMLTGEVRLIISNLDKIKVVLGNLDESGNLLDTLQVIEEYEKFKANFSVQPKGLGQQVFSGVIQEIHEKSGRYVLKPFRKEYFVIE